jgi:formylmethanofuran dehydrogenase subunit B
MNNLICPGCGSLCDDIRVEIEEGRLISVENACAKGAALLCALEDASRRAKFVVDGKEVSLDRAIQIAKRLLREAKRPLIFGLDNSVQETQTKAIHLARKLKGIIDDASSFSYGGLTLGLLEGLYQNCPLRDIKDRADLLIYWGSNPLHSHPRHLSKFSYYAYSEYDEAGWIPKVKLACIDVRDSELTPMCNYFFRLASGGDKQFIKEILTVVQGGGGGEDAKAFYELVKNSRTCVLFCGLGLVYALDAEFHLFNEMIRRLSQCSEIRVMPMIEELNMLGFNQTLYQETGYINQVSFQDSIVHSSQFSVLRQIYERLPDCVLIINCDLVSTLPLALSGNLKQMKVISLGSLCTRTTELADVVIGTAFPGWESGGSVIRMDGQRVDLTPVKPSHYPSEQEILERLLE